MSGCDAMSPAPSWSRIATIYLVRMRLLNTLTQEFVDFFDRNVPQYAILSHTWDGDEATLQDVLSRNRQRLERSLGKFGDGEAFWDKEVTMSHRMARLERSFGKIAACCDQARADRFDWVWIDTCCIDKTSSAELSEAINSMFHWYQDAAVCYVYLSDLPPQNPLELDQEAFMRTRWFTRGWTLQELIAPRHVEFYSSDWAQIGTKRSLGNQIRDRTGIRWNVLNGDMSVSSTSIAERMSWASTRQTSRTEDVAYCLLGIFGIHMPLLYGEGLNAFQRLQQTIIQTSEDMSIFLWAAPAPHHDPASVLATTPEAFNIASRNTIEFFSKQASKEILCLRQMQDHPRNSLFWESFTHPCLDAPLGHGESGFAMEHIAPPAMTSRGLRIAPMRFPASVLHDADLHLVWTRCRFMYQNRVSGFFAIALSSQGPTLRSSCDNIPFNRIHADSVFFIPAESGIVPSLQPKLIYLNIERQTTNVPRVIQSKPFLVQFTAPHSSLHLTHFSCERLDGVNLKQKVLEGSLVLNTEAVMLFHVILAQDDAQHSLIVSVRYYEKEDRLTCRVECKQESIENALVVDARNDTAHGEVESHGVMVIGGEEGKSDWCSRLLPDGKHVVQVAARGTRWHSTLTLSIKLVQGI